MILTLFGENATQVALLANRLPEVMDTASWRPAYSHGEARRFLRLGATLVRLRIDNRVLLEDILKQSVPLEADLATVASNAMAGLEPTSPAHAALTLYQGIAL